MSKLDLLVTAMAIQEGWHPADAARGFNGSASYRRHNPLNLRKSPLAISYDNNFAIFRNDMDGLAAARWDIEQKAQGNTVSGLKGTSTLAEFIKVWAPASDGNDPQGYLANVLTHTGFKPTITLAEIVNG